VEEPGLEVGQKKRKTLGMRFLWFVAGSGINYLLIAMPFKWLKAHTGMPDWAISGCSFGVSSTVFFVWNYFINFRTDVSKSDALPRYIPAVVLMWALSSGLLTWLKHFDAHMALSVGKVAIDLDVVATQFFLAGLKFFLYHKWVFPVPKGEGALAPEN
jgi:hypothetical protein